MPCDKSPESVLSAYYTAHPTLLLEKGLSILCQSNCSQTVCRCVSNWTKSLCICQWPVWVSWEPCAAPGEGSYQRVLVWPVCMSGRQQSLPGLGRVGSPEVMRRSKVCVGVHVHACTLTEMRKPGTSCWTHSYWSHQHVYVPVTDLHADQPDEDTRIKQSCLGLPWMLSGSSCADTCGHDHDHVLISSEFPWGRHAETASRPALHFYQARRKIGKPRPFAKLHELLHGKPLKQKQCYTS